MRVLYFADIRFPLERANGIQTMETCYGLASRGHDVTLVVKGDTQDPPRDPWIFYGLPQAPTLHIERANAPAGAGFVARVGYLSFAAGRIMGRTRADIVLTRDLGVASLLLRLPVSMRPPIVYESHGFAPEVAEALPSMVATASPPSAAKLRRLRQRESLVWSRAEGYAAITRGIIDYMQSQFGSRSHIAVIPDGTRPSATEPGPLPIDRTVGYAGHLYAWKGVDVLLEAIAQVADARGLIVGGHDKEPDLARAKALAATLGVADRVTFTGLVEPSAVPSLLQGATVLALPNPASAISTRFTSPLKLFEYMAARRAIVASDLPAVREVLRHDVNAVLVEPGNARALASAIQRLLDDRSTAQRLADAAYREAPQYTWERRADRYGALFTEVVARKGREG